jgi:hypothetical protein
MCFEHTTLATIAAAYGWAEEHECDVTPSHVVLQYGSFVECFGIGCTRTSPVVRTLGAAYATAKDHAEDVHGTTHVN